MQFHPIRFYNTEIPKFDIKQESAEVVIRSGQRVNKYDECRSIMTATEEQGGLKQITQLCRFITTGIKLTLLSSDY